MFLTVREGLAIGQFLGNLAAVLSALGMAIFTVTLRWGQRGDMMPTVLLGAILTAMAAAGAALLADEPLLVSAHDMLLSVLMGAVLISLGLLLYTAGSKAISAAEVALLNLLEILLAPLWVWLFLGETPTGGTLVGGAVIICAVLSISAGGSRPRRSISSSTP